MKKKFILRIYTKLNINKKIKIYTKLLIKYTNIQSMTLLYVLDESPREQLLKNTELGVPISVYCVKNSTSKSVWVAPPPSKINNTYKRHRIQASECVGSRRNKLHNQFKLFVFECGYLFMPSRGESGTF